MLEELGIEAGNWLDLGTIDPFTTSIVSPTRLFLARDLTLGISRPEGTERIRRVEMSCADAYARVLDGSISHALTCLLILRARLLDAAAH
jgi:hypothetical protein